MKVTGEKVDIKNMQDVKESDWFFKDVSYVLANGIFKGTSNTTFSPNKEMTRGEFVTILGRYAGVKDASKTAPAKTVFSDVSATEYYGSHVAWAVEKGITKGTSATTFSPNENITREDMATMMVRYANAMNINLPKASTEKFGDDAKISAYAKDSIYVMKAAGILIGNEKNLFAPQDKTLRCEVAKVMHIFIEFANK